MSIDLGTESWYDRFFDTSENLVSPEYYSPVLAAEGKIVYTTRDKNVIKLVVSDLFDGSKFHKEYKRDFSPVAVYPISGANFIDKDHLGITYLTGKDRGNYTEKYEIIDISK